MCCGFDSVIPTLLSRNNVPQDLRSRQDQLSTAPSYAGVWTVDLSPLPGDESPAPPDTNDGLVDDTGASSNGAAGERDEDGDEATAKPPVEHSGGDEETAAGGVRVWSSPAFELGGFGFRLVMRGEEHGAVEGRRLGLWLVYEGRARRGEGDDAVPVSPPQSRTVLGAPPGSPLTSKHTLHRVQSQD